MLHLFFLGVRLYGLVRIFPQVFCGDRDVFVKVSDESFQLRLPRLELVALWLRGRRLAFLSSRNIARIGAETGTDTPLLRAQT